jgi:hypothetical protein
MGRRWAGAGWVGLGLGNYYFGGLGLGSGFYKNLPIGRAKWQELFRTVASNIT